MIREIFEKFYNQLNPQQKEAVDMLEGPLMVVAGPGTGKTQVLTLRIANIILQDKARPEEILALTFTENAAFNMKRRLFQILGPAAYRARIATFHSFCNDTILENPESFAFVKSQDAIYEGARSITEVEQAKIIEEILKKGKFERLHIENPFINYITELARAISNFKREGVLTEDYERIIEREEARISSADDLYHTKGAHKGKMKSLYRDKIDQIAKNREIREVYAKYQEILEKSGQYDYNDMILFVLKALRPPFAGHLLDKLREQYKYILVDEHQDANRAQNEVVELLGGEHNNIFVVGDEKQSIFRFQGASLENILYFKNKFPQCKIITLKTNYRSPQAIIDCAGNVIANNAQSLNNYLENISDVLISHSPDSVGEVEILEAENQNDELSFIVHKIKELQKSGASPEEIAVLYRDNWEGYEIARILERAGIPHHIETNRNIFEDKAIQSFVHFLKIACRSDLSRQAFRRKEIEEEIMHALFSKFSNVTVFDVYKLADLLAHASPGVSLFRIMADKAFMEQNGIGSAKAMYDFTGRLEKCCAAARQKNALSAFEEIAKESGFLNYIVSLNSQDAIEKFKSLFNELKSLAQGSRAGEAGKLDYLLKDFTEHLDLLSKYKIALSQKTMRIPVHAVRLMTAHKSKGLEFDYVIITGCVDSRWGGRKRPDVLKLLRLADDLMIAQSEEVEDTRRLFYVALTRAKKGVFVTSALHGFDGREYLRSRFLHEIRPELIAKLDATLYIANPALEIFLAPQSADNGGSKAADRLLMQDSEYLRSLFLKRGFAATHLNNYLDCPWKYFFRNLVRLPEAQAPYLLYGNAVHFALKQFFDAKKGVDKEYLLVAFLRALERQPLRKYEFEKYRERGERALAEYFDHYNLDIQKSKIKTMNEFNVGSVMLDGEVRLTGKMDKIELVLNSSSPYEGEEGRGQISVNVVDYKTGRRKTRGEVEGKTKSSKGNEHRQLVFYKLLLDKLPNSPYTMTSGEIDFVEPEKRTGKFFKERFVITDNDVRELEYQIQDVTAEILGFAFWNKHCKDTKCRYCALRENIND